jgi:hypothetical protein
MLIQLLKQQKQHFKPLLKIAEKPDTVFALALFLCPILYSCCLQGLLTSNLPTVQNKQTS